MIESQLENGEADEMEEGPLERTELKLGFIALTDCAPLVIAKERGFFRKHGLSVELERQASWANIRDKVCHGLLDGAQMLAPMPLASTLGLAGLATPMIVPMSLSLGGNAITVSTALRAEMGRAAPGWNGSPREAAAALREVIRVRRDSDVPPLRFAAVHPHSSHYYQLCHWMAMAGIDPHRDVVLSVIPPAAMVRSLATDEIDGYAVGEPWNQQALDLGIGEPVVSSEEIWSSAPEKVFAVTEEWAKQHPRTLRAVMRALLEAAVWVDQPSNRLEAVHVIAGESFVGAEVSTIEPSMLAEPGSSPSFAPRIRHDFHRFAANHPWVSHGLWYLIQMVRWGQVEKAIVLRDVAERVYRPDLHREVALGLGIPAPETSDKTEGLHAGFWWLEEAPEPILMAPDRFMDGHVFWPDEPIAYLEGFEVSDLRVRLDDLALING